MTSYWWSLANSWGVAQAQNDGPPKKQEEWSVSPSPTRLPFFFLIAEFFTLQQHWVPSSEYMFCRPLNKLELWFQDDK